MSIQAVVGRVDQILAMQQQLRDPGAAASLAANGSLNAPVDTSAASGSFGDALSSAMASNGTTAPGANQALSAAGAADPRVQAMVNMANSLLGKPYVMGGGHAGFGPSSGYDCSGFVSAVLHAGGYLTQPVDTTALPSQPGIVAGPGQYVTIYDRAMPGQSGHVIIEINGQFYESGGRAGSWGGGGGVEKIARPSDSYLASFPTVLHPEGL
jgi:cell wall-associated NlpC family hydrolase